MMRTLRWLGRQGTAGVAAGIFLGMAMPALASYVRPWLGVIVFGLLAATMTRTRIEPVRDYLARPKLVLVSTVVMMVVTPLAVGTLLQASGLAARFPEVSLAVMVMAAAPPLMSIPALIYLMRLDGPLALTSLIACILVTPLTVPLFVELFAGSALPISPLALGTRLFALIAGAAFVAVLARRVIGPDRIERNVDVVNAISIILLFLFAVAFMDGVAARLIADPGLIVGLIALAFAIALAFVAILWWALRGYGPARALTLGIVNGNRSIGLVVGAMAGVLPDLTWIYSALAQFPIYLLPMLLKPLADWALQAEAARQSGKPSLPDRPS
jgi:BASS family bile acid:Na+ symporter